jgi:hypothetical protein
MKSIVLPSVCLLCLVVAAPAIADVTLKQKSGGKGAVAGATSGESTMYLKGLKMRTDSTISGSNRSTIIDAGAHQMIVLNHDKKEADILDMSRMSEAMQKVGVSEIKSSITPSGQTRQVAGATCTVYDVKIAVPMQMGNSAMTMVMSGPYCLVKNAPGQADFEAFYKAAAEHGLFMDANQAKAQPGLAKAMTDMYRQMGALGVPYASDTTVQIEATGPMAEMMKKMASTSISTEVTSTSTAAIADAMFEVPAGYKVNKR